ncbi:hypothetical protein [Burkholderia plantarii]|uniref:hypothetical protein n=1 Tax=Burkholderia plantarii TaxID=41899 RepID=UPI0005AEDDD0|nr:hypothetical protein [Burkholderia plantarii]
MQTMNPMLRSLTRAAATAAMIVLAGGWSLVVSAQAIVPVAPGSAQLPTGAASKHDASPNPPRDPGAHLQPDDRTAGRAGAHGVSPDARGLSPRGTRSHHDSGANGGTMHGDAAGGTRGAASGGGAGSGDSHGY